MSAEHINITIPVPLKKELDSFIEKIKVKRSTFIQQAISYYIKEKRRRGLVKDLEQGYQLMASENEQISEEWLDLENEAT